MKDTRALEEMTDEKKEVEADSTSTVSELKRKLSAAKSWVTRTCNTLSTLLSDEELDIVAVEVTLKDVEDKLAGFEEVQTRLEMAVPENEMEECIWSAAEYKDSKM